jgi:DMSO/TMAO reductase YedYZ molybdopterin-dependent catalytic subunit
MDLGRRRVLKWLLGAGVTIAASGVLINNILTTVRQSIVSKLPPGQYKVDTLILLDSGTAVPLDESTWTLEVYGMVNKPLTLSYREFRALPTVVSVSDFHCVIGWSKLANTWEGVLFRDVAILAGAQPAAKYATIECENEFTTQLTVEDLYKDDVLLAYRLEGAELSPPHGGPLRLVVPEKYGYKSAKWVRRIKFTDQYELGFWERAGYSYNADPLNEERYSR